MTLLGTKTVRTDYNILYRRRGDLRGRRNGTTAEKLERWG